MSQFTTRNLTGERVLVKGTDIDGTTNKTVLDGSQWAALNARDDISQAEEQFAAAVEKFFKPLTDAAEAAAKAVETPGDSIGYVVVEEGSEGVPATPRQIVELTHDSIVLRLIEQGDTDRLLWVGDSLEVIESTGPSAGSAAESDASGDDEVAEPTEG